jgi:anaerobic selenocysteine-containing dehydrogenase
MKNTTRRSFLQYIAMLGLVTFSSTALYAKATKDQLQYQDSPKDGNHCSNCMHFIQESKQCKIMEGTVSPDGYCISFHKKS